MKNNDNKEIMLNNIYNAKRERWVNMFAADFNKAGANVDDAVANAFAYAATYLLDKGTKFSADDLERLVFYKLRRLLKDAEAEARRTRGRRSVKTAPVLDSEPEEGEDYRVSIVDKYSYDCYMLTARDGDDVDRSVLQSLAIKKTMKKNGASDRDADIVDRFLWSAPDRKALAAEFKTSVTNVNRIKCVWLQRLPALAPQIKTYYAELLRQAA